MARLSPVSYHDLVRRLRELGFEARTPVAGILRCVVKTSRLLFPIRTKAISALVSCDAFCDRQVSPERNGWASDHAIPAWWPSSA